MIPDTYDIFRPSSYGLFRFRVSGIMIGYYIDANVTHGFADIGGVFISLHFGRVFAGLFALIA